MIDGTTLELLREVEFDGHKVRLREVEREQFKKYHHVMKWLGGVWRGGRTQAHVFADDPRPVIELVIEARALPKRNVLQFYPTPDDLVREMVAWAELDNMPPDGLILDACAGRAAIADRVAEGTPLTGCLTDSITLVEIDPLNASILRRKGYAHVVEGDFREFSPARKFKRILMNPPFNLEGDPFAYVTMILHAWDMLDEGGVLVAVGGPGFITSPDARCKRLRALVEEHGHRRRLDKGTFRESGTDAHTVLIVLERERASDRLRYETLEHEGYQNLYCFKLDMHRKCSRTYYEEVRAIFARVRRGELPLNLLGEPVGETFALLRALYERILADAREEGDAIPMREEWLAGLVHWLVADLYPEYCSEFEEPAAARLARAA